MKARLPKEYQGGAQNMNSMLRQAQKMQADIENAQAEIDETDFSAAVGGGAIEVVMSGNKVLKSIKIKPEVVDPEDVEMLEDLVLSAVNEVLRTIAEALVENPDDITITEIPGDRSVTLELRVNKNDMGKVIGKQGKIARAIRTVVKAAASKDNKHVVVDIVDNEE